mmetsp:Transcript_23227/g.59523  ORF Transcript_23227/g.59523 Transcript_23227/m.59523 type:complete len:243 (-) Transcript_23227:731-1459(-)
MTDLARRGLMDGSTAVASGWLGCCDSLGCVLSASASRQVPTKRFCSMRSRTPATLLIIGSSHMLSSPRAAPPNQLSEPPMSTRSTTVSRHSGEWRGLRCGGRNSVLSGAMEKPAATTSARTGDVNQPSPFFCGGGGHSGWSTLFMVTTYVSSSSTRQLRWITKSRAPKKGTSGPCGVMLQCTIWVFSPLKVSSTVMFCSDELKPTSKRCTASKTSLGLARITVWHMYAPPSFSCSRYTGMPL